MVISQALPDYYAVLQVHPIADAEVIEAAYRQLMKKHHPDVAGDDPARVAAHHERSKTINQAFRVLRDPDQRKRYDELRFGGVSHPRPETAQPRGAPRAATPPTQSAERQAETVNFVGNNAVQPGSVWPTPLRMLAEAYYLLPGPYEWEDGRKTELLSVMLLPILGVAGYCLATGRLSPWIGHTLGASLLAWGLLALATLPLWSALPRIAVAAAPSLTLLSGGLSPFLSQAHVPVWLAWAALGLLGLLLAARLYVFSVLPMLGVCWLVASLS